MPTPGSEVSYIRSHLAWRACCMPCCSPPPPVSDSHTPSVLGSEGCHWKRQVPSFSLPSAVVSARQGKVSASGNRRPRSRNLIQWVPTGQLDGEVPNPELKSFVTVKLKSRVVARLISLRLRSGSDDCRQPLFYRVVTSEQARSCITPTGLR